MRPAGLIPVLLILFCHTLSAQVYFDNLYGGPEYSNGIGQNRTLRTDTGYYIWSSKLVGNLYKPYPFAIDLYGELVQEIPWTIADSVSEQPGNIRFVSDTSILSLTFYRTVSNTQPWVGTPSLTLLRSDGTVLWKRTYGVPEVLRIATEAILCQGNGFALAGQVVVGTPPNEQGDGILLRTDQEGNLLWEQTFGGAQYDGFVSHLQTPDSGFLLLGWTRSFGAGQRDWYLVKTDSLGNQQWQKTYGDANNQSGSCIIATNDGNYVMCGGSGVSSGRMIKIEPDGTVIWLKNYSFPTGSGYLFKVIELPDGTLAAAGLTNNATESDDGWMIKTDANGNLLWQQKYHKTNSIDLFYSILHTEDGGFLLSGQAINEATNSQDAWLLKVDSVGCPYPNCTVGIEAPLPPEGGIWAWPNPASEVVNVQWHTGKNAIVTFTDMLGRSYSPPAQEVQGVVGPYVQYDVSTFENGLYLLTIVQNSVRTTLKVVVQH